MTDNKKRGRSKAINPRSKQYRIRLTDDECEALKTIAKKHNLSISKLIRSRIIEGEYQMTINEYQKAAYRLVIFKEDIMWSKETIKNKIYALVLIGIGALSILPENDATAFIFFCLIGVPLFFAKENWIMDGGGSDYVYEESRRESVRSASDCRRKESDGYRNSQAARRVRSQTR